MPQEKNVDKVYAMLAKNGIAVTRYHAGLDNDMKSQSGRFHI